MNLNLLSSEQQAALLAEIEEAERIVVVAHDNPDGDAIGSSLAWAGYLRAVFKKEPVVVMPDAFPDFLQWVPETHTIVRYDKHPERAEALMADADLIFCLDFNTLSRLDDMADAVGQSRARKILIDHHLSPDVPTVLNISHPDLAATSEIVFRLVWQLGHFELMDRKWAEQVYCGMMTDTGGFTYGSTRPEIFFIICQLLTKNINKDRIYRNVYNNFSSWAIRLRGYIMAQKLCVIDDLHASFFALSRMEMDDYHYVKGDAEGLVNEPLRIKGMKLSISLREDSVLDNTIWVSLRSVDDFPCNEMAAEFFNGGGHKNASGGRFYGTLRQAQEQARKAIEAYADRLK